MRTESRRPGQALVELALGMFVFALILSALLSFAAIIPESVRLQSLVRALAGRDAAGGVGAAAGTLPAGTADALPPALRALPPAACVTHRLDYTLPVDRFAAEHLFGDAGAAEVKLVEEVCLPTLDVPLFGAADFAPGEDAP